MQDSAAPVGVRRSRPGGRSERVLRRIYESTLEILGEKGLPGVTFNDVAAAAEVNRSTLYRRWSDRNELVLDALMDSLATRIVPLATGDLDRDITAVLEQIGAYLTSRLGHAALIASLELTARDTPTARRHIAGWQRRLRELDPIFDLAVQKGTLAPGFDREVAWAMAGGAIYVRAIYGQPVDKEWLARVMSSWKALFLAG